MGLEHARLVETHPFPAAFDVIFTDYALRTFLGTFSILFDEISKQTYLVTKTQFQDKKSITEKSGRINKYEATDIPVLAGQH